MDGEGCSIQRFFDFLLSSLKLEDKIALVGLYVAEDRAAVQAYQDDFAVPYLLVLDPELQISLSLVWLPFRCHSGKSGPVLPNAGFSGNCIHGLNFFWYKFILVVTFNNILVGH